MLYVSQQIAEKTTAASARFLPHVQLQAAPARPQRSVLTTCWAATLPIVSCGMLILGMFGMDSWLDESLYAQGAYRHVVEGKRLYTHENPTTYPPLAHLLWSPSQWFTGPSFASLRIQAIVTTCVMLLLMYGIAERLGSPRAGLLAVSLFVSSFAIIPIFATGTPYSITGLLTVAAFWILTANWNSLPRLAIAAGLAALVTGTRHNAGGCVLVGLLSTVLFHPRKFTAGLTILGTYIVTLAGCAALFWPEIAAILPNPPWVNLSSEYAPFAKPGIDWAIVPAVLKRFVLSHGHLWLAMIVGAMVLYRQEASRNRQQTGGESAQDSALSTQHLNKPLLTAIITTAIIIAGIHLIGPFAFAPDLITIYFLYAAPLICLLLGLIWDKALGRWMVKQGRWAAAVFLLSIMLAGLAAKPPSKWRGIVGEIPLNEMNEAAQWLQERTGPSDRIFVVGWARPNAVYLAGRQSFPLIDKAPFSWTPVGSEPLAYGFYRNEDARAWLSDEADYCLVSKNGLQQLRKRVPDYAQMVESSLREHYELVGMRRQSWPGGTMSLYRRVDN